MKVTSIDLLSVSHLLGPLGEAVHDEEIFSFVVRGMLESAIFIVKDEKPSLSDIPSYWHCPLMVFCI
jgi:hypothetical protein